MKLPLSQSLCIETTAAAAFVGCGGKTSLIEIMAQENRNHKVLIAPTTKIYMPDRNRYPVITGISCCEYAARRGIQYMGVENKRTNKLESLGARLTEDLVKQFDFTLMEADGSKGLYLKGWAEHEPVIPSFTTHTVGVVTLKAIGSPASADTVHRLPQFTELTGVKENEIITMEAVARMITASHGMFTKAKGEFSLVIHQVEAEELSCARELGSRVAEISPALLSHCIIGRKSGGRWMELERLW